MAAKQRGTSKRRAVGHVVACLAALMLVLFVAPSFLPFNEVDAGLGTTPPTGDKAYVAVSSAGEEADADDGAAGEKADDADAPAADALSDAGAVADEGADVAVGLQDAKTAEIVARAASAPSAKELGINYGEAEFERNTVLVEPMEGVTQDQVVAARKAAGADDAVVTDDIDGLLVVDIPGSLTVEDAVAALEYAEVADGAQPNFIYHIADALETRAVEDGDAEGDADVAADMPDEETVELPSELDAVKEGAEAETGTEAEQEPSELDAAIEPATVSDEQEAVDESISEDESAALEPLQTEETLDADEPTTADDDSTQLETQAVITNDFYLSKQWGLADGNVTKAWEQVKAEGAAVTVAVIDEGFDINHEDLAGNIVRTYNAANPRADITEIAGQAGHGTHVAGIIAAEANNGIGVAGVSYNAKIMPIQVFAEGAVGTSTSTVYGAYTELMKYSDVKVVNLSLAAPSGNTIVDPSDPSTWAGDIEANSAGNRVYDKMLISAIDEAYNKGIVTVAAAGNSGTSLPVPYACYPGDYIHVVSVINSTQSGTRHLTSNYNATDDRWKNISAPGTSIYSTMPNNSYGEKTGTSMAAPFVAGVLALIFAAYPNLSADDAVSRLYSTATDIGDIGWDKTTGVGLVNALAAVDSSSPYLSSETTLLQVDGSVQFSIQNTTTDDWIWEIENQDIASVDNGLVTGISGGTTAVVATNGSQTVRQVISVYNPSLAPVSIAYAESRSLSVSCTIPGMWTWSSSKNAVASVTSDGGITGRSVGTATITARLAANPEISVESDVSVSAASLNDATINLGSSSMTYTGSPLEPAFSVWLYGRVLRANSDYAFEYADNVNVGKASVTVTGISPNCTGSKEAKFTIVAPASSSSSVVTKSTSSSSSTTTTKSTTKSTASATVAKTSIAKATISGLEDKVYTGSALTQTPVVKLGTTTLRANTDYAVSYANNKNAGTATVTVTGKGNYEGTASATFTIVGKPAFTAGATKMPISSTSVWKLENCSLKVTSGKGVVTIKDTVVTAKKAGTAKVAVVNGLGQTIATKTVKVYKLSGKHALQSAAKSSLYLDVKDASKKNGGNIIAWSKTGKANQKFTFTLKNGYYTLKAANSGKLVTVAKGSKKAGANVYQWASKNAVYQRWKITVDSKNRLTFINVKSGKALGCKGNSAKKGVSVVQLKPAEKLAQKWVVK